MLEAPIIEIKNVFKSFKGRSILEDVNFSISEKDLISITGPSGIGKSTLLNILSCFEYPDSGSYLFNGEKINVKKSQHLIRDYFAFVFQNYHLIPGYTARENVAMTFHYKELTNTEIEDLDLKVEQLFDKLGILNIIDENIENLSGGEKQRVAIARGLIKKPKIIFADEPTGNLDQENKKQVLDILKKLNNEMDIAIIIVTHDSFVKTFTNQNYYIEEKHVRQE